MSLADALRLRFLADELKERLAQEDQTKGPSELERFAAEFKERMAKEQERSEEKQPEKEQVQQDKKQDKEQDKVQGRQRVIEKDWEPER